jgi:hypothetical protein
VRGGAETFREWHRPILLLAAARGAVSRADVRCRLDRTWDEAAESTLDRVLDELADTALLVAVNRTDLPDDTLFAVGHDLLADWLQTTDDPEWAAARQEAAAR